MLHFSRPAQGLFAAMRHLIEVYPASRAVIVTTYFVGRHGQVRDVSAQAVHRRSVFPIERVRPRLHGRFAKAIELGTLKLDGLDPGFRSIDRDSRLCIVAG
jgi:hypothetical protein